MVSISIKRYFDIGRWCWLHDLVCLGSYTTICFAKLFWSSMSISLIITVRENVSKSVKMKEISVCLVGVLDWISEDSLITTTACMYLFFAFFLTFFFNPYLFIFLEYRFLCDTVVCLCMWILSKLHVCFKSNCKKERNWHQISSQSLDSPWCTSSV